MQDDVTDARTTARIGWTPEQDKTMVRLMAEGVRQQDIAARLGRTFGAVKGRLRYLRHASGMAATVAPPAPHALLVNGASDFLAPRWTEEDEATLTAMASAGHSCREIGKRLGRSHQAVVSRRVKMRERAKRVAADAAREAFAAVSEPVPFSKEDDARMLDMMRAGVPPVIVAAELGRPRSAIDLRLERLQADAAAVVLPRPVAQAGQPRDIDAHLDRVPGGKLWPPEADLRLVRRMRARHTVRQVAIDMRLEPSDVEARWQALCPLRQSRQAVEDLIAALERRVAVAAETAFERRSA